MNHSRTVDREGSMSGMVGFESHVVLPAAHRGIEKVDELFKEKQQRYEEELAKRRQTLLSRISSMQKIEDSVKQRVMGSLQEENIWGFIWRKLFNSKILTIEEIKGRYPGEIERMLIQELSEDMNYMAMHENVHHALMMGGRTATRYHSTHIRYLIDYKSRDYKEMSENYKDSLYYHEHMRRLKPLSEKNQNFHKVIDLVHAADKNGKGTVYLSHDMISELELDRE